MKIHISLVARVSPTPEFYSTIFQFGYAEIFEVFVVAGKVTVFVAALPLTLRLRLAPGDTAVGIEFSRC